MMEPGLRWDECVEKERESVSGYLDRCLEKPDIDRSIGKEEREWVRRWNMRGRGVLKDSE